jgi:hypothetical protein
MRDCPNAHCHSDELPADQVARMQERLTSLRQKVEDGIAANNPVALALLVRKEDDLFLNTGRQAVQLVSDCSDEFVLSHYRLPAQYFARVQLEHDRRFADVLALLRGFPPFRGGR